MILSFCLLIQFANFSNLTTYSIIYTIILVSFNMLPKKLRPELLERERVSLKTLFDNAKLICNANCGGWTTDIAIRQRQLLEMDDERGYTGPSFDCLGVKFYLHMLSVVEREGVLRLQTICTTKGSVAYDRCIDFDVDTGDVIFENNTPTINEVVMRDYNPPAASMELYYHNAMMCAVDRYRDDVEDTVEID